ncbi:MAG TPA: serine protease [Verrucomicrobiae bacterium]|nr:serine protease [Verrucomicrobiae bacterium]
MKIFAIILLLIALALVGYDDLGQRNALRDARNDSSDDSFHSGERSTKQAEEIKSLKSQVEQLQAQLGGQPVPNPAQGPGAQDGISAQLAATYANALAIVQGKNASGSGFVCNLGGRRYLVTNTHVFANNPELKFTTVKGTALQTGAGALAVGHDVAQLEVAGGDKAFDALPDVSNTAKIGDAVTVLVNGPSGVGYDEGKIVGFGPNLIEIDAQFFPAATGCPIIHQATGKVLGVAAYTVPARLLPKAEDGGVQTAPRRFGYRLDDITQWQLLNWQTFYAQSAQVEAIKTLSSDLMKMGKNGGNFDPALYTSPALQRTLRQFNESVQQAGKSVSLADKKMLVEQFLSDLRSVSHSDIVAFDKNTAYDYFRQEVEDQEQFRDRVYDGLSKAVEKFQ